MIQRSFEIFNSVTMSEATRVCYVRDLNNFLKFTGVSDYDKLASLTTDEIQEHMENYVLSLKHSKTLKK